MANFICPKENIEKPADAFFPYAIKDVPAGGRARVKCKNCLKVAKKSNKVAAKQDRKGVSRGLVPTDPLQVFAALSPNQPPSEKELMLIERMMDNQHDLNKAVLYTILKRRGE